MGFKGAPGFREVGFKEALSEDSLDLLPAGSYTARVADFSKSRFNDNERVFRAVIISPQEFSGREFSKTYNLDKASHKKVLRELCDALPEDDSNIVKMDLAHFDGYAYVAHFYPVDQSDQSPQSRNSPQAEAQ